MPSTLPRKRSRTDPIKIRRGSIAYRTLLILQFYKKPVTLEEMGSIHHCYKNRRHSSVTRCIPQLQKLGLIEVFKDKKIQITPAGSEFVYRYAIEAPSRDDDTMDDDEDVA